MEETKKTNDERTRTIRCTEQNAVQFRALVKNWQALGLLVQSLQAQNLFPGLRSLSITLSGQQNHLDKGLAAFTQKNAKNGD